MRFKIISFLWEIPIYLPGPQQQTGFGATPFGAQAASTPSLFGQPDASKANFGQNPAFSQSTSAFGQTTGFGMGAPQQQANLFGKPTGDRYSLNMNS